MSLRQEQYRLDQNYAQQLIKTGEGQYVAYNLEKFSGLDHKEIAFKLIDADLFKVVSANLKKFQLSPQEFCTYIQHRFPELWARLANNWPQLAQRLANFPELLSELFQNQGQMLSKLEDSINENPFLLKAIQDNPRYGSRLAFKYYQFDDTAKTNVKTLLEAETDILNQYPSVDK